MNLKWKPTQISLKLSRRLFGPDRAEVTERSNNVGPDIDDAIHKRGHRSTDYIVATKIAKTLTPSRRERAAKRRSQTENWEVRVNQSNKAHALSRFMSDSKNIVLGNNRGQSQRSRFQPGLALRS